MVPSRRKTGRAALDFFTASQDDRAAAREATQHSALLPQRNLVQFDPMMTIRHAVAADAGPLAVFAERVFRAAFEAENDPNDIDAYIATAYGVAQQAAEIADSAYRTLLAEIDGSLAGFAQLRNGEMPSCVEGPKPIELLRLYVDHAFHGGGVAQTLMNDACAEARKCGAQTLWLGVWERNERAKAFYRKCGFVDVGSHIFVVGNDPQTDRVMVRAV